MIDKILVAFLVILPLGLWFYGKYFSVKAIVETARVLRSALEKEARSPLKLEYEIKLTRILEWRVVLMGYPREKEEFDPHTHIYDEERLDQELELGRVNGTEGGVHR